MSQQPPEQPEQPGPEHPAQEAAGRAEVAADRAEEARDDAVAAAAAVETVEAELDELGSPGADISRRHPFYVGFVGGLGLLLAWFLYQAVVGIGSVLVLVVVSFFLAAGLNPAVEWFQRRGLGRGPAVAVVVLVALAAVVGFALAIVPVIADQVASISLNVPGWLDRLQHNPTAQRLNDEFDVLDKVRDYVARGDFVTGIFGGVVGLGLRLVSALFNTLIIIVLTLYFLASLKTTTAALYRLAPASRRERVSRLGDRVIGNIGGYVSGAFVVALAAGLSSLVFLLIVGLGDYAVALAVVVALLDVIPMIGATLGAVIVTAIGFATDVHVGIACIVFYVVYQQIENYLIYPRVMRRTVDIPGTVTVIAALVGTALLGVVGALLAIPTASAVLLLLRELVVRRQDER